MTLLLVDAQALQDPDTRQRGIGRYAASLIRALARLDASIRVEAVVNQRLPAPETTLLDPSVTRRPFQPPLPLSPASEEANARYFADWLTATGADAVLELNAFEGATLVPRFTGPRPVLVMVAYDLIPLLFPEHYLSDPARRLAYGERLRAFAQADLVLAISEATRRDVIRLLRWPERRVVTILGGTEPDTGARGAWSEAIASSALAALGIDRPFLLLVAGADRRKNVAGAVAAFALLPAAVRDGHLLVVAGALPKAARREVLRQAAAAGVGTRVRLTGYVSDEVLRALYDQCRLSVFPSFHEGLGLPVLEALASGAPVVASDRGAIPECAGPGARLVDPASPGALAAALLETLAEPRERGADQRRRFAAGFSWSGAAAGALAATREAVAARRVRASRVRRPRIAWVSPLPPARSGIADYSAELLQHLPDDFDVEVVVSPEATVSGGLGRAVRVLRPRDVPVRHRESPFDLFVYHMGNSDLHVYMIELLRTWPGLLVLHDVFLGGLALRASEAGAWPGGLAADLEAEGRPDLAGAMRRGVADHRRLATEATLSRRMVDLSTGVVVHSGWSWAEVSRHTATPVFRVPMGVAPAGPEPAGEDLRARLGLPADRFVVATLGSVTRTKRVDRIVLALGALPGRIRDRLHLVVVGEVDHALGEELRAQAGAAGLGADTRFTGRVPLGDLVAFARAADACVQLRYPVQGETSAALLRALGAGAACVVSDAGSFSELPWDVALRVDTGEREVAEVASALVRLHDEAGLAAGLRARAARFVAETHSLDEAGLRYAAAMRLTLARSASGEAAWCAAAADALAGAARSAPVDAAVYERWAALRLAARAAGPIAVR